MSGWRKQQIMEKVMIDLGDDAENIKSMLRKGSCMVQFTKIDGTKRTMRCTLSEKLLPAVDPNKVSTKKHNPDALAVWDLDNQGWRSFRYDSLLEIEPCTA